MCEGDRNHGLASIVFPGSPDWCQPLEWPPIPPRCYSLPTAANPRHRALASRIPPRRQNTLPPGPRCESHRGTLMAPPPAGVRFPRRAYEPPSSSSPNMNSPLSFGWILRLAHLASTQRFFVSSQLSEGVSEAKLPPSPPSFPARFIGPLPATGKGVSVQGRLAQDPELRTGP